MKPEDEQKLQDLDNANLADIAADYFARILVASDVEKELESVRIELMDETSNMSSLANGIWARLQVMLEDFFAKK